MRRADEILEDGLGEPLWSPRTEPLRPLRSLPQPRTSEKAVAGLLLGLLLVAFTVVRTHRSPMPAPQPLPGPQLVALDHALFEHEGVLSYAGRPSKTAALQAADRALSAICYPMLAVVSQARPVAGRPASYVVTGGQRLPPYTKIRRVRPYRAVLSFLATGHVRYELSAPFRCPRTPG
jgi:hypothetical protein